MDTQPVFDAIAKVREFIEQYLGPIDDVIRIVDEWIRYILTNAPLWIEKVGDLISGIIALARSIFGW